SALLLDPGGRGVDIFHVEVKEPERKRRSALIARHDSAELRAAVLEDPVDPHRSHVHGGVLLPSEELGVKLPSRKLIVGREFIPTDGAGRSKRRTGWCIVLGSAEQQK